MAAQSELAGAGRPGAPAGVVEHTLGDDDLLLAAGLVGERRELLTAVRPPRAVRELHPAGVAVAGVDAPVAAGLAVGHAVPDAERLLGTAAACACSRPEPSANRERSVANSKPPGRPRTIAARAGSLGVCRRSSRARRARLRPARVVVACRPPLRRGHGTVTKPSSTSNAGGVTGVSGAVRPAWSRSTVPAMRRARVSARFASSIHSTYSRWCEYDRSSNAAAAPPSAASAAARSSGIATTRGSSSSSIVTSTTSPAATPAASAVGGVQRQIEVVAVHGDRAAERVAADGDAHGWALARSELRHDVRRHSQERPGALPLDRRRGTPARRYVSTARRATSSGVRSATVLAPMSAIVRRTSPSSSPRAWSTPRSPAAPSP